MRAARRSCALTSYMFPEPRPALGIKNVEVKQRCARRRRVLAGACMTADRLRGRRYTAAGREEMMVLVFDINAGGQRAGSPPLRRRSVSESACRRPCAAVQVAEPCC